VVEDTRMGVGGQQKERLFASFTHLRFSLDETLGLALEELAYLCCILIYEAHRGFRVHEETVQVLPPGAKWNHETVRRHTIAMKTTLREDWTATGITLRELGDPLRRVFHDVDVIVENEDRSDIHLHLPYSRWAL
jgi:hypothetical protein